jgi:hypothetical protein
VQPSSANYEIRLRDGSIIYADSLQGGGSTVLIQEASGIAITVSIDEIAQIRAGPALAQSLAELDWKAAASPATAPAPTPRAGRQCPAAARESGPG